jgi:2'-hydroxyisoflavone reductase
VEILFLGGTSFLGRHAAGTALERGHDVTLFHRGTAAEDPYPEAEHLHGDRDGGLGDLRGRTWDAVIDTSGYAPRVVRASIEFLSDAAGHYTFVSTCSVYSDLGSGRVAEDGKLYDPAVDSEDVMEHYGGLKAGCERVVEERFGGRSFVPRPGLIVGPYDPTDRVLTKAEMLETCGRAAGSEAELVWVDEEFLLARGVQPWTELPLWLPSCDPESGGFSSLDASKAIAAGLTFRPLIETARDTLDWHRHVMKGEPSRAGPISREREAELLASWER